MNLRSTLALVLIFTASHLHAGDKPVFTYEGEVAGVMCSACSNHVKGALSKLDGVTSVTITPSKQGGAPHLQVVSTSPKLTQAAAVKALGEQAKMYVIQNFKLTQK